MSSYADFQHGLGRSPRLLEQARRAVLPALTSAFGEALGRFDDALFDRAERAGPAQMAFLDGMRELRRQREPSVARFRDHLEKAWRALEDGKPLSVDTALTDANVTGLSLLSETELESRLAARNLASVVGRDCRQVLQRLDRRLAMIAGIEELDAEHNPIGAEHVGVALHEAFAPCDFALEVRLTVLKLGERELVPQLGRIYDTLDLLLAQAGVMPEQPTAARRPVPRPAAPPPAAIPGLESVEVRQAASEGQSAVNDDDALPAWMARFTERLSSPAQRWPGEGQGGDGYGAWSGAEAPLAPGAQGVLLEALHHLLQESRSHRVGDAAAVGPGDGRGQGVEGMDSRSLSKREMLSVLSMLQTTPSDTLQEVATGSSSESLAQRLKSEVIQNASRLGMEPGATRLSPVDEDAIDLVGMLFDVMLDERDLETHSRELMGKLVVPFVKVALLDRRMFVQKTHPARRLLNVLAEACEGNTGESQADRTLLAKVEEVVDRLVAEFNENLAIFQMLEEEFRDFLGQHKRRIEIAERRATELQRGQERLEAARARAAIELAKRLESRRVPQTIEDFLRQPWAHHLTMALLREGEDSQMAASALALADGVLHELAEAQAQVVGKPWLSEWRHGLIKVFSSVGMGGEAAGAAIDALHDTLQAVSVSRPDLERALPDLPPVAEPAAQAAAAAAQSPNLALVGGTDALEFDSADAEHFRGLPIGTWLDFIDKDNKVQAGKLSWVSPISARLLFVNRRGVRFCVASPEELAVMVRLGRLRRHRHEDAFDSAMQGVIDRLDGVLRQPGPG
ncbi:DUF1631 domain-containing protein [Pseudoxanthomonas winnipegensis]|jgi:hypothetical protein|uniref:DUF1631 domain-containing protein n=1 Tax=Pseudoxanthomonas winnipegensis TaxID=2480810 RepID=A0ABY1WHH8_9GAMM|nr:DUF1631 domain-containing protein [Pseudoxanthomonas winnipegensis]TAA10644.1 DUF1631 domain-containing protein [Pseudoxanthomonas winnipegensis]TAA22199.1 DUF1631 domain-containing protein [Pseudoxanthomonas winnipegensis]TAH74551.1 DUF1631 domain-containing protein [Pseudoxanthomonas winnipegensis]